MGERFEERGGGRGTESHDGVSRLGSPYYFVLSLFPALIALIRGCGIFARCPMFDQILALMARFVPADSMGVVRHVRMT